MCEYCENVNKIVTAKLVYEVEVKKRDLSYNIETFREYTYYYESETKANYCPNCGRKLV